MEYARPMLTALLMTSSILNAQQASLDSTKPADRYGWTVRTFTADEIRQHPARDLRALISLMPGIVALDADGGLYGRGSRNGQIEYRVNGIDLTDRFTNGFSLPFIPEAFEQVSAHVGPYGALLGAAPGGLVDMQLRRGGETWSLTAQHLTDDFAPTGSTFLRTSSFGQHTSVITAGGPLPFETRLFVVAEIHRMRDRDPRWVEPFSYTLRSYAYTPPYGGELPWPLEFRRNHRLSNSLQRSSLAWNLTTGQFGVQAAFWGVLSSTRFRDADEYAMLRNYYRQDRIPWQDEDRSMFGVSIHGSLAGVRLSGTIVRDDARSHTSDPDFGEDWRSYVDSAANAAKGYEGFVERYYGPPGFGSEDQLWFNHPNAPNSSYFKRSISNWRAQGMIEADLTEAWKIAVRAEAEWWTLRSLSVSYIPGVRLAFDSDGDGIDDRTFINERELEYYVGWIASSYGFDVNGESVEDGWRAVRRPYRTSVTAVSRWQEGSLDLELGLRGVWNDTDVPTPVAGDLPGGLWAAFPYDNQYQLVEPSALGPASRTQHWLPRASASVKEGPLEIRIAWGKYLATLPFAELHLANSHLRNLLGSYRQTPWDTRSEVLTSSARPEVTTASEGSVEWYVLPHVQIGATMYVKDMPSQIQLGYVRVDTAATQPTGFVNTGESRSMGAEISVVATPSTYARLQLSYAFQRVRGMGSSPRSNFVEVADPSRIIAKSPHALDYEQAHRLVGEVRLSGPPETWLTGLEAWLTGRLGSGRPYTRMEMPLYSNMAPWYASMAPVLYPQLAVAIEERNTSRSPWTFLADVAISYRSKIGPASVRAFVAVSNLLNTKEVVNVFPTTGSPTEDGWLRSELGQRWAAYSTSGTYTSLYRDLILKNRHAYLRYTGQDIYARPRQLRLGVELGL